MINCPGSDESYFIHHLSNFSYAKVSLRVSTIFGGIPPVYTPRRPKTLDLDDTKQPPPGSLFIFVQAARWLSLARIRFVDYPNLL
jgi:hypothetical protein